MEVIREIFWIPVGRKCNHAATDGLRVEQGHCVVCSVYICGCTGTMVSLNLPRLHRTRTHLLLAGNDTVPISVCRSGGMCSSEFPVVMICT